MQPFAARHRGAFLPSRTNMIRWMRTTSATVLYFSTNPLSVRM